MNMQLSEQLSRLDAARYIYILCKVLYAGLIIFSLLFFVGLYNNVESAVILLVLGEFVYVNALVQYGLLALGVAMSVALVTVAALLLRNAVGALVHMIRRNIVQSFGKVYKVHNPRVVNYRLYQGRYTYQCAVK